MKVKIEKLGKVSITVDKDEHNSTNAYDRLVIVQSNKTRSIYISRKPVPAGIDITNTIYWKLLIPAIRDISDLIPEEASADNKLADKQFVINEIEKIANNVTYADSKYESAN